MKMSHARCRVRGLPGSLERIHGEWWSHHFARLEEATLEVVAKRNTNEQQGNPRRKRENENHSADRSVQGLSTRSL
jgi:hypothetical protein